MATVFKDWIQLITAIIGLVTIMWGWAKWLEWKYRAFREANQEMLSVPKKIDELAETQRQLVERFDASEDRQAILYNELEIHRAMMNEVIDSWPTAIWLTDTNGLCTYVNDAWVRLFGVPREEALKRGWSRALHIDDRQRILVSWDDAVRITSPWADDYRIINDDEIIHCEASAKPYFHLFKVEDGSKHVLAVAGFIGKTTEIERKPRNG